MRKLLLILGLGIFLNSCSSTNHTYRTTTIQDTPVLTNDVIVDVKVDLTKKIASTSSKRPTVDLAKAEAYYEAITKNKIDIVVDPIFEINTTDKFLFFGGKTSVKLIGFAGYYTNPRSKLEAIKELKTIETLDIHKFNAVYLGIPFPQKQNAPKLKSVALASKSANTGGFGQRSFESSKAENQKAVKSNFGVKIGKETIKFQTSYGDFETSNYLVGWWYESNPNDKLGLRSELLGSFGEEYNNLNLPILAKYSLTRSIKVFAGPSLTYFFDTNLKDLSFGLDFGASVDLGKSFFVDLKYSKGINDIGTSSEVKALKTSLGLGFRF